MSSRRIAAGGLAGLVLAVILSTPVAADSVPVTAGSVFRDCSDCPEMVVIPAGEFHMGSSPAEAALFGLDEDTAAGEGPRHKVTIGRPFALGKYAVTRDEFEVFVKDTGFIRTGTCAAKGTEGGSHPVVCISWQQAKLFVAWLSRRTGQAYRLPTEAEWEYAARAGTATAFWWGDEPSHDYANFGREGGGVPFASGRNLGPREWLYLVTKGRSDLWKSRDQWEYAAPVGQFPANTWGLHDMSGNVWQWTEDCYQMGYATTPADGSATPGSPCCFHVARGGSWLARPTYIRSSVRIRRDGENQDYILGLRVARDLR